MDLIIAVHEKLHFRRMRYLACEKWPPSDDATSIRPISACCYLGRALEGHTRVEKLIKFAAHVATVTAFIRKGHFLDILGLLQIHIQTLLSRRWTTLLIAHTAFGLLNPIYQVLLLFATCADS